MTGYLVLDLVVYAVIAAVAYGLGHANGLLKGFRDGMEARRRCKLKKHREFAPPYLESLHTRHPSPTPRHPE